MMGTPASSGRAQDLLGQREAVHLRHHGVEEHQGERLRRHAPAFQRRPAPRAPPSTGVGLIRQLREHLLEDAAVRGVVVHHQDWQVRQGDRLGRRRARLGTCAASRSGR